jgi:hypothetical protein
MLAQKYLSLAEQLTFEFQLRSALLFLVWFLTPENWISLLLERIGEQLVGPESEMHQRVEICSSMGR